MGRITIDTARVLGVFADVHAGTYLAVAGENRVKTHGGLYDPRMRNEGQLEIYGRWAQALEVCDEFDVDTVLLLGDLTDGTNRVESGYGQISTDLEMQKDMALDLLKPLCEDRVVHVTNGSIYHESMDTKIHRQIAHRLEDGAEEVHFHGFAASLDLKGTDKNFIFGHEWTSAMLYTATMLDREHIYMKYAEALGKIPHFDYALGGHLHKFYHIDTGFMHLICVPGWKSWYPYKGKLRLYGRMQPDIGFVIIIIDDKNRSYVKPFVWNAPHILDEMKEG